MSNSINFNNGTENISVPVYASGSGYDTFPIRYPNGDGSYQTKYALLTTSPSKAIDKRIKLTKTSNNTKTVYYFTSASKKIIVFYDWDYEYITGGKDAYGESPYYPLSFSTQFRESTSKPIVCNPDGSIDSSTTYGIEFFPGYHYDTTVEYSTLTTENFKLTYDSWLSCLVNESYFFQDYFPVFLPVNTSAPAYSFRYDYSHSKDFLYFDVKGGIHDLPVKVYKLNHTYSDIAYFSGNLYNSAKTNISVSINNFPTSFLGATQRYYANPSNDTYCYCDYHFYRGYFNYDGIYHHDYFTKAYFQEPLNAGDYVNVQNFFYNGKNLSYTGAGAHLYYNLKNLGNGYNLNSDAATFLKSEQVKMFQNVYIGTDRGKSYKYTVYGGGSYEYITYRWSTHMVWEKNINAYTNSKAFGTYTIDDIKSSDVSYGYCSTYGCPFFAIKFNG